VPDRREKPPGSKPAARIHHHIKDAARRQVDNETVDVTELFTVASQHVETVKIHDTVVDVVSVEVAQA
jgi:hypothetical protein